MCGKIKVMLLMICWLISIDPGVVVAKELVDLTVLHQSVTAWNRNFNIFAVVLEGTKGFVYEPLVIYNGMDTTEIPWLAEEVIAEDDMKTIIVKVRKGIKWSDGQDFNADDVYFNFTYSKVHPEADYNGLWGDSGKLEHVEKIDDYTVKLVLREASVFGKSNLFNEFFMVPEHIWNDIEEPTKFVVENPVGTGPFTEVIRFAPQLFIMGRNPHYWQGDKLEIDRILWPQYNSNDAAYDLLLSGKIDWAHIFIPDIERVYVAGDEDKKYWFPPNDVVRIVLNMKSKNEGNRKAFNNVHFRRAFSLAMDRQAMIDIGIYGYVKGAVPATGINPALDQWRSPAADKVWSEFSVYDLDKAKEELSKGGFKDVDHDGYVENADGTPIKFNVEAPSGWTDWVNNIQIAVEGLRKIGIDAGVATPELNAYVASWAPGEFDVQIGGVGGIMPNIHKFYDQVMTPKYFNTSVWWSSNASKYENPERDILITQLKRTRGKENQKKITDRIEMIHAEEIPYIPLFYNGKWFVYSTARFTGWVNADHPDLDPAIVKHDNKLLHVLQLKPVE